MQACVLDSQYLSNSVIHRLATAGAWEEGMGGWVSQSHGLYSSTSMPGHFILHIYDSTFLQIFKCFFCVYSYLNMNSAETRLLIFINYYCSLFLLHSVNPLFLHKALQLATSCSLISSQFSYFNLLKCILDKLQLYKSPSFGLVFLAQFKDNYSKMYPRQSSSKRQRRTDGEQVDQVTQRCQCIKVHVSI